MTKQEPFMPTVELTDDFLVRIEGEEVMTWGELKKLLNERDAQVSQHLFGDPL